MAVKGYFYNATDVNDKERMYNGEDMNQDKAPFYKEGVAFGHLQVTAEGGSMDIKVDGGQKTGYAYINLHTIHNNSVLTLTLSQASGTLPRIDRVVLQNNETERKPKIYIKEGTYSSEPQPPMLTNDDAIQEKSLAQIYVAAGAVEITQADVTDERADESVCGFIASQFQDINFEQVAVQFDEWINPKKASVDLTYENMVNEKRITFDEWFANIKEQLSDDAAGNLQNQIGNLNELTIEEKENLVIAINKAISDIGNTPKWIKFLTFTGSDGSVLLPDEKEFTELKIVVVSNGSYRETYRFYLSKEDLLMYSENYKNVQCVVQGYYNDIRNEYGSCKLSFSSGDSKRVSILEFISRSNRVSAKATIYYR